MDPADAFAEQARGCVALGSPMYGGLLNRLAEDIRRGGPTAEVLIGHEDDPGPSALALRLLGSVHRLVLERRAGALATYYPSVGGTWSDEAGTAAFLHLLEEQPEAAREWLDRPPQTNEVGRAAGLMGGLLQIPREHRLPVRLCEIGSSGGLNLLVDLFAYVDSAGTTYGPANSPVVLEHAWAATTFNPWPDLEVVARLGCDSMPVDVTSTEGRLALTAYVWPDQRVRIERLRAALELAQRHPPVVQRQGAADFLDGIALESGTLTVVWHSVMWQYVDPAEQERIRRRISELGYGATDQRPFAHLYLEPPPRAAKPRNYFVVVLTTWPGGVRRVLGRAAPHGLPVTWE